MIELLLHQQDFVVAEDHAAHVHFGRGVPALRLEQRADGRQIGAAIRRHHLDGDLLHLLVALAVKGRRVVIQPGLSEGLQPLRPVEYFGDRHWFAPIQRVITSGLG